MLSAISAIIFDIEGNLPALASEYGALLYLIIFLIILVECGIVVAPITGNSLLFLGGVLAAEGGLDISYLIAVSAWAAFVGYAVSYWTGKYMGTKVFRRRFSHIFTEEKVARTNRFFDHYGPTTVVMARFIPMVRKFAPFLAGTGSMDYGKFTLYNFIGAVAWTGLLAFFGFLAGHLAIIQEYLGLITAIVIIFTMGSILLTIIIFVRELLSEPADN
jgi:membrane-associated protein